MNIPEEALTAFYKAEIEYRSDNPEGLDRTPYALRAAARIIAAQALRDAADLVDAEDQDVDYEEISESAGRRHAAEELEARARELEEA